MRAFLRRAPRLPPLVAPTSRPFASTSAGGGSASGGSAAPAAPAPAKYEDLSLEGRYSGALLGVTKTKNNMDKVFQDLEHVRGCYEESSEFKMFVESPAFQVVDKMKVLEDMGSKYKYDPITVNYLKTLLENRRLPQLKKMIDNFENFYRAEKGQMMCQVTSVAELSAAQKTKVEKALAARAKGAQLMVSYRTSPGILGGLVVKMGESVLDFSVLSRLDRLTTKLMAPM